tara:strand:+ start:233 stop:514 length:282 start_codon:yes stop_codon:yes gene_type:complete
MEAENAPDKNLSEEEIRLIRKLMADIVQIAEKARDPVDPKVELFLEGVYSILAEQIHMDKKYSWGPPATQDDRFLSQSDIPSADDLRKMVEGD